jgi:FtsP/CotA-like multicopper oxidase with cupredoxin domain
VWEIVNTTADAHPIHLHLTQVQIINRQMFNSTQYMALYESLFPALPSVPDRLPSARVANYYLTIEPVRRIFCALFFV